MITKFKDLDKDIILKKLEQFKSLMNQSMINKDPEEYFNYFTKVERINRILQK